MNRPLSSKDILDKHKAERMLRRAAKLGAAYQAALRPRLLVPASLGLLVGVAGALNGGPLPPVYQGSLLLGFLSYKAALIVKLVDDLTPKVCASQQ